MFKKLSFIPVLSLALVTGAFGQGTAVRSDAGTGTNNSLKTATNRATVTVVGANTGTADAPTDLPMKIGTLTSGLPGLGIHNSQFRIRMAPTFGGWFETATGREVALIGPEAESGQWIRGVWHDTPTGNQIPQGQLNFVGGTLRNSDAAADIYFNSFGGSGSALSDLPVRGDEIWDNQRKPYLVISTREAGVGNFTVTCTFANVVSGVDKFRNAGYQMALTNMGVKHAFILENGFLFTNRHATSTLLHWNTNNFPGVTSGTVATNVSTYLRTNGFEGWLLMYGGTRVPSRINWSASTYSEFLVTLNGAAFWEYPGGNGGVDPGPTTYRQPSMTLDSFHKDISSIYASGFRGLFIQDQTAQTSSGYFDQMTRAMAGAALNPYFNPGQASQIALDAQWSRWYPGEHGMILGLFAGSIGVPWSSKFAGSVNSMYTESNDTIPEPSNAGGLGWIHGQVRYEAQFLTNAYGFCHPTFGTDGADFNSYDYTDWQSHFAVNAMFHGNIWLTGDLTAYNYFNTATPFGTLLTNRFMVPVWQDVTGSPVTCLFLNNSNSAWMRPLSNGDKLILLCNLNGGATTNLSFNWGQLGIPSNTIATVTEVWTNQFIDIYTNVVTVTVPVKGTQLLRVNRPATADPTTNNFQIVRTSSSTEFRGKNNKKVALVWDNGSTWAFGDVSGGFNINSAVVARAPAGASGRSLSLQDSSDITYGMVRDSPTGNMRLIGEQAKIATGLDIESTEAGVETKMIRISGGMGVMAPTNVPSGWPTAALTHGGYAIVNSNGTPYLFVSSPASTAWTATNELAAPSFNWAGNTGNNLTVAASTFFYALNGNSITNVFTADTSTVTRNLMTRTTTLQNFVALLSASPGASRVATLTVMTNGVASSIVVAITSPAVSGADTTHKETILAGTEVGIKIDTVASATSAKISWALEGLGK